MNEPSADQKASLKSPGSTSSGSLEEDSAANPMANPSSNLSSQPEIPRLQTQSSFQSNTRALSPNRFTSANMRQMPHLTSQTSQPYNLQRMSSQQDGSCLIEAALSIGQQSRPQPPYQPLDSIHSQQTLPQQVMPQQTIPHQSQMLQPRIFPPNANDQQLYPIYAPPYHDLSHWLENTVDVGMQPLPYGLDIWGDSAMMDFMDLAEPFPTQPTPRQPVRQKQSFSKNVPDERFQRVERLWPLRRSIPPHMLGQTLWQQVVDHSEDNLFSDSALSAQHPYAMPARRTETSRWGLGEDTRGRLIREYGSAGRSDSRESPSTTTPTPAEGFTSKRSDTASDVSLGARFPPAEVLDMSLDLYFKRFYSLWPFIHRATFDARATPTSLLLPMCLIGLELLDADGSKKFIRAYMPDAIDKVRNELTARALPSCQPSHLLTTLASAILVLRLAAANPVSGLEEQFHCLYSETISLAQRRGLFTAYAGQQISIELLRQGRDDETAWKAWSRVEAAKRLIVSLIMLDSICSNILDVTPIVRIDTLGFCIPCSTALFDAPTARRWAQVANSSNTSIITNITTFTFDPSNLPGLDTEIAIQGLLSGLWLRLSEARHRLLDPVRFQSQQDLHHETQTPTQPRIPLAVFALDSAHTIAPLLASIPIVYAPLLNICNPSTNAFWHAQCMSLLADLPLFELAAGREGPERAKRALEEISVWSHTPAARRACIHAAQAFAVMGGRRISDGTTFHSEIALFHGALVLGLYLFTVRGEDGNLSGGASVADHGGDVGPGIDMNAGISMGMSGYRDDEELFELLEPVDWASISSEGMSLETVNPADNANNHAMQQSMQVTGNGMDSAAKRFIMRGGTVSFNGAMHRGGYNSARRILLDYANLMKSVAKWNVRGYCRILRIMSDTLIEVDDMMSASE